MVLRRFEAIKTQFRKIATMSRLSKLRLGARTALVAAVLYPLAAPAHSRGPYFPANVNVPGVLLDQWDPSEYPLDGEIDPHTREVRPFGLTGVYVLVKTATGFESGYVVYDCEEIDDGAYGAMSCQQSTKDPSYITLHRWTTCPTPAPRAAGCQ